MLNHCNNSKNYTTLEIFEGDNSPTNHERPSYECHFTIVRHNNDAESFAKDKLNYAPVLKKKWGRI